MSIISVECNPHSLWCHFNKLLRHSPAAKRGQLSATGWFEDVIRSKDRDDFVAGPSTDAAVLKRKSFIARSREFEIVHRPRLALFNQESFLQPNVSLKLMLFRVEVKKVLRKTAVNNDEYKILVTNCTFWVRKVTAHPGLQSAHVDLLANSRLAKYSINRVRMAMHVIPPNVSSGRITRIPDGQFPTIITIMFIIRHQVYEGSYLMGPHEFPHYRLQYLELLIDGQSLGHIRRIEMDYTNHRYTRAYTTTMCSLGRMFAALSCGISYEDLVRGNAVYSFDITSGLTGLKDAELVKNGTVTGELKLAAPLAHTFSLAYCEEFDDQMTLGLDGLPNQIGAA